MNQKLNEQQLAAVESDAPNIVVLGSPGCGKTSVLAERLARRLLMNPGAKVAAITYTIAAAKELRERCFGAVILPREDSIFIGTIHSLALSLLRGPWAKFLPCNEPLTVMTQERNKRAVAEAIAKVRYKGTMKALDLEFKEGAGRWLDAGGLGAGPAASLVVSAYYQACRKASLISYDDLIKVAREMCQNHAESDSIIDELLVDEYQDASSTTDLFLAVIPARNRFYVLDPRQSIFGWLGGSPSRAAILLTSDAWQTHHITQSYRCSPQIAQAANRLMSFQNGPRLPEMLPAAPNPAGDCCRSWELDTAADEMWEVSEAIKGLSDSSATETFAVLARTNFIVGQFAEYLQSKGIPVVQSDKAGLPENWEQILAAAAVVDQPKNDALVYDLVSLIRGQRDADRMRDAAILAERPMIELLRPSGAPPRAATAEQAVMALEAFVEEIPGDSRALPLIHRALDRVGPDATVAELRLALNDPGLRERESEAGGVDVSTIHGYKGREADHVFLVAMNEGILPGPGSLEESRRLAFVGITRARISCTLTCARERLMGTWSKSAEACKVSRFVSEAMGKGSL